MKHRMAFGAAAIAAVVSMPAFAGNLVTNGSFETNFGAGQFNQTLPGSSGGQNANHSGTTATGWTVSGTDASFPDGYAFVFRNNNSFTTTNGSVGRTSGAANPSGSYTLPLWGNSGDGSPDGTTFTGSIQPITLLRSPRKSVALSMAIPIPYLRLCGCAAVRLRRQHHRRLGRHARRPDHRDDEL